MAERPNALSTGPKRKPSVYSYHCIVCVRLHPYRRSVSDPLVGHGRHFRRTVHAMVQVSVLVRNGIERSIELEEGRAMETFSVQ
jgi:hypothetical protein